MVKMVCRDCGFKVENAGAKKCPYCNKERLEREKSAEELLDSIDEE